MNVEGMGATLAVNGATTATVFEAYVEKMLAPSLKSGQIVIMDNLLRPTKEFVSESSSKGGAANYCTCRPTLRL
jgi:hypothetical protein